MKTLKPLLFLLFQQILGQIYAQSPMPSTNFESIANLNTIAIPNSLGSFLVNPAALCFTEKSGLAVFQQHYLQIPSLISNSLSYQNNQRFSYGLAFQQFGNASTHLFQPQASLSKKIYTQFGLGVSVGFQTLPLEFNKRQWQPLLGVGFCWWYSKQFQLGLMIHQPMGEGKLLNLAATWQCTPNFKWSIAIQQQALLSHQIRSSFSYQAAKDVQIQVAFGLLPMISSVSFEFPYKKSKIGIAMMQHALLGFQSGISLKYVIK